MKNNNLLEDAIADANLLKESAIETAKLALQEKFMPKLEELIEEAALLEAEQLDTTKDGDDGTPAGSDKSKSATTKLEGELPPALKKAIEKKKAKDKGKGGDDAKDVKTEMAVDVDDDDGESEALDEELQSLIEELELMEASDEDAKYDEDDEDDDKKSSKKEGRQRGRYVTETESLTESEITYIMNELTEDSTYELTEDTDDLRNINEQLTNDLSEAYDAITLMRDQINEVSLMNSKLLYTTKLFNAAELTEAEQKGILSVFDRATTVREVKLVYTTMAGQLNGKTPTKKRRVYESFGSDSILTKGKTPLITEDTQIIKSSQITRLQKLANIQSK